MLLDELKKLGKGMVTLLNTRLIYVDFKDLSPFEKEPYVIADAKNVFEIFYQEFREQIKDEKGNPKEKYTVYPIVVKYSNSVNQASHVLIRLGEINNIEVIGENSNLYKFVVKNRSNLVLLK